MSCFVWNETIGRNVVVFADDLEFTLLVKNVYFYWNIFFSFTAMFLNGLLCIVIYWFPNPMIKINPMLLANAAFDFLFGLTYFLYGRYIFVGYQRLFPTLFGLIPVTNPILMRYINFLITMLAVTSWNFVLAQFVYRFLVVRYNEQPRGFRLFWFLIFCFLFGGLHFFSLLSKNSYSPSAEEIDNSIAIFRHYDFDVTSGIYGNIVKPGLETTFFQKLPLIFTVSELLVILFCTVATRRILRQSAGMKIASTRRLNQSMDRTIAFMVLIPIISNVIPTFANQMIIFRCESNAILSAIFSSTMISASFLNACVTICFIKAYRSAIFKLLTLRCWEKPRQNVISITGQ